MEDLVDLYRARAAACGEHDRVFVRELRLKASCRLPDPEFPVYSPGGEDARPAIRARRAAYWEGQCTMPRSTTWAFSNAGTW